MFQNSVRQKFYQIITVFMNLQSPTTLLSSIQSMRSRLRSDKQRLQDIKNQFNHISKKSRPSAIQTILQQSVQDLTNNHNLSLRKEDLLVQQRQNMKKDYLREILKIKQQHQRELYQMRAIFEQEKKQIEQKWKEKCDQQSKYIAILEEQVKGPTKTERQKVSNQQYDAVINQLLQENTRLHNHLQQSRDQSENWRRKARHYMNQIESKERFKFMAKRINQSRQRPSSSRNQVLGIKNSVKSEFILNDQNIDRSNFNSRWQDYQIQNDEGGLRTIKQFPMNTNAPEKLSSRAEYLSLKL